MSDEGDAKILNEVQNRFDVNITELPDEIDLSSYSKCDNHTLPRHGSLKEFFNIVFYGCLQLRDVKFDVDKD